MRASRFLSAKALGALAVAGVVVAFSFSSGYTTQGTTLVPDVEVTLPTANFAKTFSFDLGSQAAALGIQIDGNPNLPGNQPIQISVAAHLDVTGLAVGIPLESPDPYLVTGLHVNAGFTITIPAVTATVNLSLLKATISISPAKTLTASVDLAPQDTNTNSKLDVSELVPSNVLVTPTFSPFTLNVTAAL